MIIVRVTMVGDQKSNKTNFYKTYVKIYVIFKYVNIYTYVYKYICITLYM